MVAVVASSNNENYSTPSKPVNNISGLLATNHGRAILVSLLILIPLISHWGDFFATTPSQPTQGGQSDELISEAFNSYRLNMPLFEAVKSDNLELVRSLLEGGIDDKDAGTGKNKASSTAAGQTKKSYYNVNSEDPKGLTPLIEATLLGNRDMVELLLVQGARAQPATGFRHTALRAACLTANPELIQLLLSKGADPNAQSDGGRTPLMGACYLRPNFDSRPNKVELSFVAVNLMLGDTRTDPLIKNEFGESALDLCRQRSYNKSVDLLQQRIAGKEPSVAGKRTQLIRGKKA